MSEHCGSVTAEGAAVCIPGQCSCSSDAKNNEPITATYSSISRNKDEEKTMWQKIRSGVLFGIACITSPCCTPLFVPLGLALLAGTPMAVWLAANIGLVYGGLTLISIASFVLAYRWMSQKAEAKRSIETTRATPVHEIK